MSISEIKIRIDQMLEKQKSLMLATLNQDGTPEASYAPFARQGQSLIILVSKMVKHTKNLTEGRPASILVLEDEACTPEIYARNRLGFQIRAQVVTKEGIEAAVEGLKMRHGKTIDQLLSLPDFVLIELEFIQGKAVFGFGQAFQLDKDLNPSPVTRV